MWYLGLIVQALETGRSKIVQGKTKNYFLPVYNVRNINPNITAIRPIINKSNNRSNCY